MNEKENHIFYPHIFAKKINEQLNADRTIEKASNLNLAEFIEQLEKKLGLTYLSEIETEGNVCFANSPEIREDYKTTFFPKDILNYTYAVLHSLPCKKKYKEFLKNDFPRLPCPKDSDAFWRLVAIGGELRTIHLMESSKVEQFTTSYPKDGDNIITNKIEDKDWELFDEENQLGRIWINKEQYFDNIPINAWELYIGDCQPAQKWLKDRKEQTLEYDDILHYQKIIGALSATDRLMKEIDKIEIE